MFSELPSMIRLALALTLVVVSSEALFFKWGSDNSRQALAQKSWMQVPPNMAPSYRYYSYNPYEQRKLYQQQYQPEIPQYQQSIAPIPISVPAGASLTPVSLQHVQLVPCMCPVAPEEADKLQEQVGPGPYLAQTYASPSTYAVQQSPDTKTTVKQ